MQIPVFQITRCKPSSWRGIFSIGKSLGCDDGGFVGEGEEAVDPADLHSVALHAAEPSHLALGKAAYVGEEVAEELFLGALAQEVARDVSVFEAVAHQTLGADATVEQALHFGGHALFHACTQAALNAVDHLLARQHKAEDEVAHGGQVGVGFGVAAGEFLYLEGADEAVAGLGVGVVVELDERGQAGGELLVAVGLERASEVGVDGGVGELVGADDGVDIEACAAAEDGLAAAPEDALVGGYEVVEEAVGVVFLAGVADVDEVVGDVDAVDVVVGQVFACAYVHAAEDLARVGADHLALQAVGHLGGEGGLACGGGSQDGDEQVATHRGK